MGSAPQRDELVRRLRGIEDPKTGLCPALGVRERGGDSAVALQEPNGHDAFTGSQILGQSFERQLRLEVPLFDAEQRLLGRAREIRRQCPAALLDLGLEGPALVVGGDQGQADAGRDEQRHDESGELDLEGSQHDRLFSRPSRGGAPPGSLTGPKGLDPTHEATGDALSPASRDELLGAGS